MCDFICLENIKSLIDHIVIKHMSKPTISANTIAVNGDKSNPSLEEIANPHVDTFKQVRKAYQDNNAKSEQPIGGMASGGLFMIPGGGDVTINGNHEGGLMMNGRGRSMLNKKGLEDQVSNIMSLCCTDFSCCIAALTFLSVPCSLAIVSASFARLTKKNHTLTMMMMIPWM